jgi:hypothetical protein
LGKFFFYTYFKYDIQYTDDCNDVMEFYRCVNRENLLIDSYLNNFYLGYYIRNEPNMINVKDNKQDYIINIM